MSLGPRWRGVDRVCGAVMPTGFPRFSRVSGFGPLAALIAGERNGRAFFLQRGLDLAELDPTTPIPFALMNEIFERASREVGDPIFGARVGAAMRPEDYGAWVDYVLAADTLGAMIGRHCATVPLQTNAARYTLDSDGTLAVWRLTYPHDPADAHLQHALHFLPVLIDALRRYVGREVSGAEARVPDCYAQDARQLEGLLGVGVRPRSNELSLAFPAAWLRRWRPIQGDGEPVPPEALPPDISEPLPTIMTEAIIADLRLRMAGDAEGEAELSIVASDLGLTQRTVQRALNAEGVSYRDLLRHTRIARARVLLATTGQPIAEVALRSGYSDQANFHRAFAAVTGMTPNRYRLAARGLDALAMAAE